MESMFMRLKKVSTGALFSVVMSASVYAAMRQEVYDAQAAAQQSAVSKPAAFILCGTSGAGKSTLAKDVMPMLEEMYGRDGVVYCAVDQLEEELFRKCKSVLPSKPYAHLKNITLENFTLALRTNRLLKEGKIVVVDTVFGVECNASEEHADFVSVITGYLKKNNIHSQIYTIVVVCMPKTLVQRTNQRNQRAESEDVSEEEKDNGDRSASTVLLQFVNNFQCVSPRTSPEQVYRKTSSASSSTNSPEIFDIKKFSVESLSPSVLAQDIKGAIDATNLKDPRDLDRIEHSFKKSGFLSVEDDQKADENQEVVVVPVIMPDLVVRNSGDDEASLKRSAKQIINFIEEKLEKEKLQ